MKGDDLHTILLGSCSISSLVLREGDLFSSMMPGVHGDQWPPVVKHSNGVCFDWVIDLLVFLGEMEAEKVEGERCVCVCVCVCV